MASKLNGINLQAIHKHSDVMLLDDIDTLRSQGISHFVALPQLVVCGDQSSGKSSVLEAISGIPFPTKDNLCTRFATEVVLRRSSTEHVSVTICPGPGRESTEQIKLNEFRKSLAELNQLGDLMEEAKSHMGLDNNGAAFADDVLRIDISGQDLPHLTIVDLPGLIHSHSKTQSTEDVELVKRLVQGYMESSRSIILAIVSAKNDYANQIVLKMAREVDPYGRRTLGIITKPDTLPVGSESEASFLSLAKNLDVSFHLGWHVLKNRSYESRFRSLEERNREESEFLSSGVWNQLPRTSVTVTTLRARLSKVLLVQIKRELPAVIDEIEQRLADCGTELRKLGQSRQTTDEQRRFLLHLAQEYQSLARAGIDGVYGNAFFGDPRTDAGYERRIRAVMQNLSLDFAETMRRKGHRYEISQETRLLQEAAADEPETMSRENYLNHAKALLIRSRGRELPGTFNPLLIADLFHEQSTGWRGLAQGHVKAVWTATRRFVESALFHLTQDEIVTNIVRDIVDPLMEQHLSNMLKTVDSIIDQYQGGHPITYNHYFTETIQNVRAQRMEDDLTHRLRKFLGTQSGESLEDLNFSKIKKSSLISALSIRNEADMDRYACAEAVDCMFAFYKVAMKAVVDNVATQCVESQLIRSLPHIFSPATVIEMDANNVSKVAEESPASTDLRNRLIAKKEILESGLDTCRRHATMQRPTMGDHLNNVLSLHVHHESSDSEQSDLDENDENEILADEFSAINTFATQVAEPEVFQETSFPVSDLVHHAIFEFGEPSSNETFSFDHSLPLSEPKSKKKTVKKKYKNKGVV